MILLLLACKGGSAPVATGRALPDGFVWGASMAGFQVDPGCPTLPAEACEDRHSDWYVWVTDPELVAEEGNHLSGEPLSHGPGHWELYEQDFALAAQELSLGSLRTSIEWSRLFPDDPGEVETVEALAAHVDADAVAAYRVRLEAMRAAGLTPMITLNHYTIPTWLHDARACHEDLDACEDKGWVDRDRMLRHIALYAGFAAQEFGDLVDVWITLNEPLAVVLSGYLLQTEDRTNPPGVISPSAAFAVMLAQIEAHAAMYDAIHASDPTAVVGAAPNLAAAAPLDPEDPQDLQSVEHFNYLYNRVFLDGTILGHWDADLDGEVDEVRPELVGRTDFIGVNYYTRITVDGLGVALFGQSPLFDFLPVGGFWESYPEGMAEVLGLAADYGLPIYITENGTSTWTGDPTADFLLPHLHSMADAIEDGADVRGYYLWSLLDNYEWNHGMAMRFGLAEVDVESKARTLRPMARDYAGIAAGNRLPD